MNTRLHHALRDLIEDLERILQAIKAEAEQAAEQFVEAAEELVKDIEDFSKNLFSCTHAQEDEGPAVRHHHAHHRLHHQPHRAEDHVPLVAQRDSALPSVRPASSHLTGAKHTNGQSH